MKQMREMAVFGTLVFNVKLRQSMLSILVKDCGVQKTLTRPTDRKNNLKTHTLKINLKEFLQEQKLHSK